MLNNRLYIATNKNPKTLTQINKYIDNKIIKFSNRPRSKTEYILNQCCNDSNLKKISLYDANSKIYTEYFLFKIKDDNLKLIYTEDQKEIQDKKILNDLYRTAAWKFGIENYRPPYETNKVSKKIITILKKYNVGNKKTKINNNNKQSAPYKKFLKAIKQDIRINSFVNKIKDPKLKERCYTKLMKRMQCKVNEGIKAYYKCKHRQDDIGK